MKKNVVAVAAALVVLPGTACAEGPDDSFWGELSYFYPTITSTARLDLTSTSRPGTTIKLEDDLDLDDRKGTPYLTLGMRLGERWRLEFEYYQLNRSGARSIDRQIEWGDTRSRSACRLAPRSTPLSIALPAAIRSTRRPCPRRASALACTSPTSQPRFPV